jgi:hypothetical protein
MTTEHSQPATHPTTPLPYADAIVHVERWLEAEILTSEQRERDGLRVTIYDYFDRRAASLQQRPWCGVHVAEVDFHNESGGSSYMQVDAPWGIAVCAQVERCILALVEAWNQHLEHTGSYETDEEFERLRFLLTDADQQQPPAGATSDAGEEILRVILDHEAGLAPERTVRAEYLTPTDLVEWLDVSSNEGAAIIGRLRRGIPYHDRLSEEDVYLISAGAVGHPQPSRPIANTGAELRELYDQGCRGVADIDMDELLWRIFADVRSSYSLALHNAGVANTTIAAASATVDDYLANHYGSN